MKKKDSIGEILLGRNYGNIDKSFKQITKDLSKSKKVATNCTTLAVAMAEQNRKLAFDLLRKAKL